MSYKRINGYQCMWVLVLFDLPTQTKTEKKEAARFRKELEKDGFIMHQFSIYKRPCPSLESAMLHQKRVVNFLPIKGDVTILFCTDKQYGKALVFSQRIPKERKRIPLQLEIF